jgi:hypothetical protein
MVTAKPIYGGGDLATHLLLKVNSERSLPVATASEKKLVGDYPFYYCLPMALAMWQENPPSFSSFRVIGPGEEKAERNHKSYLFDFVHKLDWFTFERGEEGFYVNPNGINFLDLRKSDNNFPSWYALHFRFDGGELELLQMDKGLDMRMKQPEDIAVERFRLLRENPVDEDRLENVLREYGLMSK